MRVFSYEVDLSRRHTSSRSQTVAVPQSTGPGAGYRIDEAGHIAKGGLTMARFKLSAPLFHHSPQAGSTGST
jgi:hypothetical protein